MKQYAVSLFLILLFVTANAATQERGVDGTSRARIPDASEKYAVIIGVANYNDAGLRVLPNAVRDATALRDALISAPGGFRRENVLLMTDDSVNSLHKPTRNNIIAITETWFSLADSNDLLLLYFAGHGVEDGGKLVLMPQDARSVDVSNTGVAYTLLQEKMNSSAAKLSLVILDTCHSGAGRSVTPMTRGIIEELQKYSEGRITLASCRENEYSHEYNDQHGAFTWFLLQGFQGDADENHDGAISALELSNYTFEHTSRWAAAKALKQTPRLITNISGDIILARLSATGLPSEETPETKPPVVDLPGEEEAPGYDGVIGGMIDDGDVATGDCAMIYPGAIIPDRRDSLIEGTDWNVKKPGRCPEKVYVWFVNGEEVLRGAGLNELNLKLKVGKLNVELYEEINGEVWPTVRSSLSLEVYPTSR